MIRGRTAYLAPRDEDEVVAAVANCGDDAVVVAGGTMILPTLARLPARTRCLVDLTRAGLSSIECRDSILTLGATVTYAQIIESGAVAAAAPLLARAARGITGGHTIRAQGTVGGSACYANPASDVPGCLVALDAILTLRSATGAREVPARRFFADAFATRCGPDEVLVKIAIPARRASRDAWGYHKLKFSEGSWPIATAACVLEFSEDGSPTGARIVLGAVSRIPVGVDVTEALQDADPSTSIVELAREAVVDPWEDVLAPAAYRREVAGVVAARAFQQARAFAEDEYARL